jgi:hypothetical protein
VYFTKWEQRDSFVPPSLRRTDESEEESAWRLALRDRFVIRTDNVSQTHVVGYALLLVFVCIWGIRLALIDYRDGEAGGSFMHLILLPIHEAGHILFIPFGEFMTILGGSLFQLLLPLIAAGTVLWQNRDPFGASIGVWWFGVSMMDLAPYIYDAKVPQLILLGGHTGEDGPHDWIYLLGVFGKIQQSQSYGAIFHTLGVLVMLLGVGLAAGVLWRMRAHISAEKNAET